MWRAEEALTEIQFPRGVVPPASYTPQGPAGSNSSSRHLTGLVGKCDALCCPASPVPNHFLILETGALPSIF